jgi:hypothetical protein
VACLPSLGAGRQSPSSKRINLPKVPNLREDGGGLRRLQEYFIANEDFLIRNAHRRVIPTGGSKNRSGGICFSFMKKVVIESLKV